MNRRKKKKLDTFQNCDIVIGVTMKTQSTIERIKVNSPVGEKPRSVEANLWHKDYNQFDRTERSGG